MSGAVRITRLDLSAGELRKLSKKPYFGRAWLPSSFGAAPVSGAFQFM